MEYAYATCILNESGEEINEKNLVAVLEAAGCQVQESRVKAIVAALEDVEIDGITAVDEVGGPDHSTDRRTDGSVNRDRDGGSNAEPTAGSELTAIEADPDSETQTDADASVRDDASGTNAQSDDTSRARPDTEDDKSTTLDAGSSGRPNDGV